MRRLCSQRSGVLLSGVSTPVWGSSSGFPSSNDNCCCYSVPPLYHPLNNCSAAQIHMNPSTMRKWNKKSQGTLRPTEYDFDKERLGKNFRMDSLDCIIDPRIEFEKSNFSIDGAKRGASNFLATRRLKERFPKFSEEALKSIYEEYKRVCNDVTIQDERRLLRVTTQAESSRIAAEKKRASSKAFAEKSWKSMKISEQSTYSVRIDSFEVLHTFYGVLSEADWAQLTVKVRVFEKRKEKEEEIETVEYPVFEICLGDGNRQPTMNDLHIVAVMNEDGVRYGKDADHATQLRKGMKENTKWWR